jgi:hypothetical protein
VKQVRAGEWGLEVQTNLMPPGMPKVNLFSLFWIFWGLLVEGFIAFQIIFFVLYMKKETSDDISARRLLQTK